MENYRKKIDTFFHYSPHQSAGLRRARSFSARPGYSAEFASKFHFSLMKLTTRQKERLQMILMLRLRLLALLLLLAHTPLCGLLSMPLFDTNEIFKIQNPSFRRKRNRKREEKLQFVLKKKSYIRTTIKFLLASPAHLEPVVLWFKLVALNVVTASRPWEGV